MKDEQKEETETMLDQVIEELIEDEPAESKSSDSTLDFVTGGEVIAKVDGNRGSIVGQNAPADMMFDPVSMTFRGLPVTASGVVAPYLTSSERMHAEYLQRQQESDLMVRTAHREASSEDSRLKAFNGRMEQLRAEVEEQKDKDLQIDIGKYYVIETHDFEFRNVKVLNIEGSETHWRTTTIKVKFLGFKDRRVGTVTPDRFIKEIDNPTLSGKLTRFASKAKDKSKEYVPKVKEAAQVTIKAVKENVKKGTITLPSIKKPKFLEKFKIEWTP